MPVGNGQCLPPSPIRTAVYYLPNASKVQRSPAGNIDGSRTCCRDILRQLETQHASFAATGPMAGGTGLPPSSRGIVDIVKPRLSRHPFQPSRKPTAIQDSLESFTKTRSVTWVIGCHGSKAICARFSTQPSHAATAKSRHAPSYAPPQAAAPRVARHRNQQNCPNPVAETERKQLRCGSAGIPFRFAADIARWAAVAPKAISEFCAAAAQPRRRDRAGLRPIIARAGAPGRRGETASPTERIAASKVPSVYPGGREGDGRTSSFIAAAAQRRQGRRSRADSGQGSRGTPRHPPRPSQGDHRRSPPRFSSLLVARRVVVIVSEPSRWRWTCSTSAASARDPSDGESEEPQPRSIAAV